MGIEKAFSNPSKALMLISSYGLIGQLPLGKTEVWALIGGRKGQDCVASLRHWKWV